MKTITLKKRPSLLQHFVVALLLSSGPLAALAQFNWGGWEGDVMYGGEVGNYVVIPDNPFYDRITGQWRVDHPPIADASATGSTFIALNGVDALVTLDGARSFDPDGDPLVEFWWFEYCADSVLATSLTSEVRLPVGIHSITLLVFSDGFIGVDTASAVVQVEVITPAIAIERIIHNMSTSSNRNTQPLLATLQAAAASIKRNDYVSALNQLNAFQNKAHVQLRVFDPALLDRVVSVSQLLIDALRNR